MRLADNLNRHQIADEFEFRPDRTLHFGVTCSLVPKKAHNRPCPEHSLLSFYRNFMKLADNLNRHKFLDEIDFRPDRIVTCP